MRAERGIALVMALLVVALATLVAVNMMVRGDGEFRRAEMQLHGEQALQYALGAEQWVAQILYRDRRDSGTDHRGEDWAVNLPPLPVDGGSVIGRLDDLQGRFNLTNLVAEDGSADGAHLEQFRRLLQMLGVADQLSAETVLDFIDPDQEPTPPDGAEDGFYLTQDPPYRAPNRPLMSIGELMLARDADPALLQVLDGHVVSLPRRTPLNVNTAPAAVLMTLAEGLSMSAVEALVDAHEATGFDSLEAFSGMLGMTPDPGLALSLASDWFLLTVRVDIGTMNLTMYSLLERLPDGHTRVVARQRTPW